MIASEKVRKICVPMFAEIHHDLGGIISMGDVAAIIAQRMQDACMEMYEWTQKESVGGGR
jgi:hypothetical protein